MPTLGRIPSPDDPRDHPLSLHVPRLAAIVRSLPPRVDPVRRYGVLDQGSTPQCVAYSGVLSRTIGEWSDVKRTINFDAPQLYARCKALDGIPNEDGTYLRTACGVLLHEGANVIKAPRGYTELIGTTMKIAAYARLTSLNEVKAAIQEFGSAWLGSTWYASWFSPTARGFLPEPDFAVGGHAYLAIGYNDLRITPWGTGAFLIQNSWGREWGLTGKAWLPYAFVDLSNDWDWEAWRTIDLLERI
jgi:hypothetical protein